MDRKHLSLSAAAAFLLLCLYYRGGFMLLPIVTIPVAVHELSHILALRLLGQRITGILPDAWGLCICYDGPCSAAGHILAALAGPVGGAAYAVIASFFTGASGGEWIHHSVGMSMLLTAYNLLPIMPLDGGRILFILCAEYLGMERGTALFGMVSGVFLALLLTGSAALVVLKKTTIPLAAAIWLLLYQNDEEALVKSGEII